MRWKPWPSMPKHGEAQERRRPRGGARPSSTPGANPRARRFLAASEASWEAGTGDLARQAADAALATCTDPLLHADIVRARARIALASGELRARSRQRCVPRRSPSLPWTRRERRICWPTRRSRSVPAWDVESNVEIARAARDAAGDSDDPLFDFMLGFELGRQGATAEATQLLEAAERAIVGDSTRRDDPRELDAGGPLRVVAQRPASGACALNVQAVDRARELGLAGVVARALVDLADGQIRIGAWDDAEAALVEAIRLGEDTGQPTSVGMALSRRAEIAARRGAADEFEELNAAAANYTGVGNTDSRVRAQLALSARARHGISRARDRKPRANRELLIEQLSPNALDLIEAYIRAGAGRRGTRPARRGHPTRPPGRASARRVHPLPGAHGRPRRLRRAVHRVAATVHG